MARYVDRASHGHCEICTLKCTKNLRVSTSRCGFIEVRELFKFNEWWDTGRVDGRKLQRYRRYLFTHIPRYLLGDSSKLQVGDSVFVIG